MDIMTLLMAQRGGGTGGGSGGGSVNSVNGVKPDSAGNVALKYDDLTDKPFEDTRKFEEVKIEWDGNTNGLVNYGGTWFKLSDLTPTIEEMQSATFVLKVGGETFTCKAPFIEVYDDEVFGPGGYSLTDESDNYGLIVVVTKTNDEFSETGIYFRHPTTLTYTTVTGEIKTIDPKFLPEGVPSKSVEEVRFVDNLTATSEYNSNYGAFCIYLEAALEQMPLTGNCKVVWDGVTRTHPIVEAEIQGEIYHGFGNLYMFSSFGLNAPNTGEPYAVLILPNRYAMVFTMDQSPAEHTVTVAADDAVYHPMDQRYLDIPTLDFVALGLSAIPQNQTETAIIAGDFTDIYETLLKNWVVKVRFDSQGSQLNKYNCVAFVNRHPATAQFILTVFGDFTFKFTVTRSGIVGQYRGTL